MTLRGVIERWDRYWFPNAPLLDLAMLRIIAVGAQLGLMLLDPRYQLFRLTEATKLLDSYYKPLPFLRPIVFALGGHKITAHEIQGLYILALVFGFCALIGLFSRYAMFLFAFSYAIIQLWLLSFGDIHHPEAAMTAALIFLALSPSGAVLSVDAMLRKQQSLKEQLLATDHLAKWPILLLQWFFGLMYISAFWAKLWVGNFHWANGFTLQYYLAEDGMRWHSLLGVWMSQYYWLSLFGQWAVLLFQATFFLSLLFPRLKWFYVPMGMAMHIGIYLMFKAPFFQWVALYFVFIPWTAVFVFLGWLPADQARRSQLIRASAA